MEIKKLASFSFIEVLVVAVIIGILAVVGISGYNRNLYQAKLATFQENAKAIENCINIYFSVNHKYPDSLEYIRPCLKQVPIDPFTQKDMLADGSIIYAPTDGGMGYTFTLQDPEYLIFKWK